MKNEQLLLVRQAPHHFQGLSERSAVHQGTHLDRVYQPRLPSRPRGEAPWRGKTAPPGMRRESKRVGRARRRRGPPCDATPSRRAFTRSFLSSPRQRDTLPTTLASPNHRATRTARDGRCVPTLSPISGIKLAGSDTSRDSPVRDIGDRRRLHRTRPSHPQPLADQKSAGSINSQERLRPLRRTRHGSQHGGRCGNRHTHLLAPEDLDRAIERELDRPPREKRPVPRRDPATGSDRPRIRAAGAHEHHPPFPQGLAAPPGDGLASEGPRQDAGRGATGLDGTGLDESDRARTPPRCGTIAIPAGRSRPEKPRRGSSTTRAIRRTSCGRSWSRLLRRGGSS